MAFSAKKFAQKYGMAGVCAYSGITFVSITSIYVGLRSGVDILAPVEIYLGSDSEFVLNLKKKLKDTSTSTSTSSSSSSGTISTTVTAPITTSSYNFDDSKNNTRSEINWIRELVYFGVAGALDSLILPLKLAICLPLTRHILKTRGGRRP